MNTVKEAKLNMYHAVIAFCDANPAVVALIVAFSNSFNNFKTKVSAIVAAQELLEVPLIGHGAAKRVSKRTLARLASQVAAGVFAYADDLDDEVLKAEMNYSFSGLFRMLDDQVGLVCNNIYNRATSIGAALNDYGVDATVLGMLQSSLTDYLSKKPSPRLSVNQRKQVREGMDSLYADADKILKNKMDKMSLGYRTLDPDFKAGYDSSREIIDPGVYHTVLKLTVLHAITGEPVRNVRSYMDDSDTAKRSTAKGTVLYRNPEQGLRHLLLKHRAFHDYVLDAVPVSYGVKAHRFVLMEPKVFVPPSPDAPELLQQVVLVPALSTVNVGYSFVMQGHYQVMVTNPVTSSVVFVGFGPDENTLATEREVDRGFTLLDTALNLGFSAANRKLNFRNDTSEDAAVVLLVKK